MDAQTRSHYDQMVAEALEAADAIYKERASQYNTDVHLSDYFPDGPSDYFWILHTKVLRVKSLAKLASVAEDGTVLQEAMAALDKLRDEALDIVNYSRYLYAHVMCELGRLEVKMNQEGQIPDDSVCCRGDEDASEQEEADNPS